MTPDTPSQTPEEPGRSRWLLFGLPILGAVVLVFLTNMVGSPPRQSNLEPDPVPVRYVTAKTTDVLPRAIGYGTVTPRTTWQAVTEVSGKVIYKNPSLRPGILLSAGTEILRIDPTDYELTARRLEANIASSEASLADIKQQEENSRASLAIENRALELAEADLKRNRELRKRGTIAQSALDSMERSTLQQQQTVQNLRNQLALYPTQISLRESELEVARVQLEEAKRNIERTVISLPINGRVLSVSIEENQVTAAGQSVANVDGIEVAEVIASVQIDRLTPLFPPRTGGRNEMIDELLSRPTAIEGLFKQFGFTAKVSLQVGTFAAQWDADVIRVDGQLDPKTRTVGVVVAVKDPYARISPRSRPPLTRNMFVEVEIRGFVRSDMLVIPRVALRQNQVHVLTADDRLEIRDVRVMFEQGHIATIAEGIEPGERIIVTELSPAIPSTKLSGTEDEKLVDLIGRDVRGEAPAR